MPRSRFEIGDLVEITMIGSEYYQKHALVVDIVPYTSEVVLGEAHPDEYSCVLYLINPSRDQSVNCVQRAKWLRHLSKIN